MREEMPSYVTSVDVLRNLREGDVVWIKVADTASTADMDVIQEVVGNIVSANICLIVTKATLIEDLYRLPLKDIMQLYENLGEIIQYKSSDIPES